MGFTVISGGSQRKYRYKKIVKVFAASTLKEKKPMELRHLRYFCAVADHGSFSEASRELHISQSAISEQIADLEREIGGALLDRHQRRIRLTPHGLLFLDEARKTLIAAERAVDIARRSLQGQIGTLAIGFFLWGA